MTQITMSTVFAAFKRFKSRRASDPKTWKRKGIPRSEWCGTKTTFDQRANFESTPWCKLESDVKIWVATHHEPLFDRMYAKAHPKPNDMPKKADDKPKRKYVKAADKPHEIPNLKALFAEPPKPKRKYVKATDKPHEIPNLNALFAEPPKPKRKYVRAADKPPSPPKRKYVKKSPTEKAIASLKPIIRAAIRENN